MSDLVGEEQKRLTPLQCSVPRQEMCKWKEKAPPLLQMKASNTSWAQSEKHAIGSPVKKAWLCSTWN